MPSTQSRSLGTATTGFFFQMKPTINQGGATVDMIMSLVNHTGYADDGTPVLASRSIDTLFKIPHDGRTITVGGMVRQRHVDSANKMPWLGDIPVLGSLFGGESHLDQRTAVFATLNARIVQPDRAVDDLSAAISERAQGARSTRAPANDPGFIRK